ncbi:hypothetical protein BN12_2400015 [Nostocoides japonicum T1-X7]|uniref:Uncharacterized protein n=1 Tax=Nostocoides japonicum T1-X7 TaxID=1194083 RepID=A0A077LW92_9MICO|nr:hypothetical protein BN12_2400015 [Tetrasphaera japonica T1-X7]
MSRSQPARAELMLSVGLGDHDKPACAELMLSVGGGLGTSAGAVSDAVVWAHRHPMERRQLVGKLAGVRGLASFPTRIRERSSTRPRRAPRAGRPRQARTCRVDVVGGAG